MIPEYYLMYQQLTQEESLIIEYKGHRSFTPGELNPKNKIVSRSGVLKPSRQYISKHINGMINSGSGGAVFCGVKDDGVVAGFMLNKYQRDHIRLALKDVFERCDPPVSPDYYLIDFVPVLLDPSEVKNQKASMDSFEDSDKNRQARLSPHKLNSYKYCWCDMDSFSALHAGYFNDFFVIIIRIAALKQSLIYPYKNEDGFYYIRRNACNEIITKEDLELEFEERRKNYNKIKKK